MSAVRWPSSATRRPSPLDLGTTPAAGCRGQSRARRRRASVAARAAAARAARATTKEPAAPVDIDLTTPGGHQPVLLERVRSLFATVPTGWIIDGTLGRAGHAAALLGDRDDLKVLGIDRDPAALAAVGPLVAASGGRLVTAHARFDALAEVAHRIGADPVVGILLDLGVSSPQLDEADRGFSYRHEAPLDMRMDPTIGPSAADVVNGESEAELARILSTYGDERYARRIARAIVAARPVRTTTELADLVASAIPAPARRHGGHPAKRTFQALRIHVNGELDALSGALDAGLDLLAPGGRFVVISYHSGEDRLVKARFRRADDGGCTCPPGLPCGCGATPTARLLKRGAWQPDAAEQAANPRSASARLRAVKALTTPEEGPR